MKKVTLIVSPLLKILRDPARFKKLKDGWVRDSLCGVEWGPSSDKCINFKEAQAYCKKVGGRLPEVNELQSLVDYSKHNPAIDTTFFPDTKTDDWYWTRTKHSKYESAAWCVVFHGGGVGDGGKDYGGYVRPVRASQ